MYIKKFNELLNTWQVASFDFLGSVGNGAGKWQKECWRDGGHPNDLGHTEMFYSISPSLFDNLIDQYYSIPASDNSWMSCKKSTLLTYKPKDTIHSFSMALRVRLQSGYKGNVLVVDENIIGINKNGNWSLTLKNGRVITSKVKAVIGKEYHIALTSSYANSYVKFYINAKNIGKVEAKLVPVKFSIGGSKALFKDFLLYRSCLSLEAVQSLSAGTVLRSSLELYAPLTDKVLTQGILLINSSQTGTALILESGSANNIIPPLQR